MFNTYLLVKWPKNELVLLVLSISSIYESLTEEIITTFYISHKCLLAQKLCPDLT